jgi:hypothetical protein
MQRQDFETRDQRPGNSDCFNARKIGYGQRTMAGQESQRFMDRIMSLHETVIIKLVRAEAAQAETQIGSTCLSNHEYIEHTPGVSSRHEIQESESEQKQEAEGKHTDAHPNALENYDYQKPNDSHALSPYADKDEVLLEPVSKSHLMQAEKFEVHHS